MHNPRVCRDGSLGDPCDEHDQCGDEAYCLTVCREGEAGEPCTPDPGCYPGVNCVQVGDETYQCSAGEEDEPCAQEEHCEEHLHCSAGTCQDGWEGADCDESDGHDDCEEHLFCVAGTCFAGTTDNPCTGNSTCADGFHCGDGRCHNGSENKPCDRDEGNDDCQDGLVCANGFCSAGDVKDYCDDDEADCLDFLHCSAGRCEEGGPESPCDIEDGDDDCEDQLSCVHGTCREGLEGDPCIDDQDCDFDTTPFCVDGHCYNGSLDDPCQNDGECIGFDLFCTGETDPGFCELIGFVRIDPDGFQMGCHIAEDDASGERCCAETVEDGTCYSGDPNYWPHPVTLTRSFHLQANEVSIAEWKEIDPASPIGGASSEPDHPATNMTWFGALLYANALSEQEGLEQCYLFPDDCGSGTMASSWCETVPDFAGLDCEGFRLPTEAEWEYAVRGNGGPIEPEAVYGDQLDPQEGGVAYCPTSEALDELAWYCGNTDPPQPQFLSTSRQAIEPGLYNMLGNAAEWVWDAWGPYPDRPMIDPLGFSCDSEEGCTRRHTERVIRGGGVESPTLDVQSAARSHHPPDQPNGSVSIGFRLVRTAAD